MHVSDTPQHTKTVRFRKHGRLFKRNDEWIFESGEIDVSFTSEMELVNVLDELSMDGYDLVCGDGSDNFILRSKGEFEEVEEWYEFDDEK
jgi:hypothetical protein